MHRTSRISTRDPQYEDIIVTQMNSLWFDEPDSAPIATPKRKSVYPNKSNTVQDTFEAGLQQLSKKSAKWLSKFNKVINNYNRPVGKMDINTRRELTISTPFAFNHVGHISENDTFGIDKLFNLGRRESDMFDTIIRESPLESIAEDASERVSVVTDLSQKRHTRAVSSFMTKPISDNRVMKRSISDKSVNSSLLFSRSNSVSTVMTTASINNSPRKQSSSGNSLRSLMELEKTHQRSLSGGKISRSSLISRQNSITDISRTHSVVGEIKEEEELVAAVSESETVEEPAVEIVEEEEVEEESTSLSNSDSADTGLLETPELESVNVMGNNQLDWDSSPLSFMRSSWIYKDDFGLNNEEESKPNEEYDMVDQELMMASFKAGKYSRRSRLSLQQNFSRVGSVYFADTRSVNSELVDPISTLTI